MTKRDTYLNQLTAALRRRTPGTGSGSGITALTGDVTATGPGSVAATIANDAVTNAKLANMAEARIKGREDGAGTGDPQDLTANQASVILDGATDPFVRLSALSGGSPGPGGVVIGTVPVTGWTVRNGILWNDYLTPLRLGMFVQDATAPIQLRLLTQSLGGASEYTVIATLNAGISSANSTTFGLYIYDGTKAIGLEIVNDAASIYKLRVIRFTNVTTVNSVVHGPTANINPWPVTLKIEQDATNRTYYYYENAAFTQFYQEAAGSFLTETDVGPGGISAIGNAGAAMFIDLWQWSMI